MSIHNGNASPVEWRGVYLETPRHTPEYENYEQCLRWRYKTGSTETSGSLTDECVIPYFSGAWNNDRYLRMPTDLEQATWDADEIIESGRFPINSLKARAVLVECLIEHGKEQTEKRLQIAKSLTDLIFFGEIRG